MQISVVAIINCLYEFNFQFNNFLQNKIKYNLCKVRQNTTFLLFQIAQE